jgi:Uma2 family endonuclease
MLAQEKLMTVEELAKLPPDQSRGELIGGIFFQRTLFTKLHGSIAANVLGFLGNYVKKSQVGRIYMTGTGFILARNPDTVRAPDAAFVQAERLGDQPPTGFFEGAPDLAVEVISPSETVDEVESKVIDYLEAGSALVWLIYPRTQTVTVYRSLTDIKILTIEDTLTGGDLLPGFSVSLQEIFE